jgi:hypothetical protein
MRSADWLRYQLNAAVPKRRRPDAEWEWIVAAYRACGTPRPKQIDVAARMGFDTEQPLRDRLRPRGIKRWPDIHARIALEALRTEDSQS